MALLATGNNFDKTHERLMDMMRQLGSAFNWSESHCSQFELSKLALMDFSPGLQQDSSLTISNPQMNRSMMVKSVLMYRFLGVLFNPKLKWTTQMEQATWSAEAWISLVGRLTCISTGLSAKDMRQLYVSVVAPKMLYAADVWYTLLHKANEFSKRQRGSIKFMQKLHLAQR